MPHDLDIANGSGAAVRADINGALAALGSSMKGPNAPPAPVAGMIWVDDNTPSTTRWTVAMFDGAAWITLGILDTAADIFEPASTATGLALIRAADAAAARTAIGATATGSSIITAADATAARAAAGALGIGNFLVLAGSWSGTFDLQVSDSTFFDISLPDNVAHIIGAGFVRTDQTGGSAVVGLFDVVLINGAFVEQSRHTGAFITSTVGALANSGITVGFQNIAAGNTGWRLRFVGRKSSAQGPFNLLDYQARIMCVTR